MLQITNEKLEELKSQSGIIFVDFHAEWCQPCKYLSKQLEPLVHHYDDNINFVKIL